MTDTCFRTTPRARRRYVCDWACGDPIEKGSRYTRAAYPPHTEPNESEHWVTYRGHGPTLYDCPMYANRASDNPAEKSKVTVETPPREKE
jgi:hypothetical protein